jgi:hypothetical protein
LTRIHRWLALLAIGAALPLSAGAEITATDLQIAARALGFMEKPPRGLVRVGIVYASDVRPSLSQAGGLEALLGPGLKAGNLDLRPVLVEAKDAANANVDLFFLTGHLQPADVSLSAISAARRIPCITADIAQVRAGTCAIGIRSKPKVEVFVHRGAAQASGTSFATAFRVMINEL